MASSSLPSFWGYPPTTTATTTANKFSSFTSSSLFPSILSTGSHEIRLQRSHADLLTRTHAKFEKFETDETAPPSSSSSPLNDNQHQQELPPELIQVEEEDDSCLPNDLEGAVRQSSEASAIFVSSGGMRAIVELLIPQLQFLDDEGAQAELWDCRGFSLRHLWKKQESRLGGIAVWIIMRVKAIFPDAGAAALLKYQWKNATFGFASLSDRKPVESEDELVVMVVPDYQMLQYVEKITKYLSDDPPRPLIMWNPRLISADVGVGFNVRNLKRYFLSTFTTVYSMKPFPSGAVFRCYPGLWKVFYDDKERPNRYLLAKEQIGRPDSEELDTIFGDVEEKSEDGPSFFDKAAGVFSSINRFMKAM